jgi:hypothetical protein
MYHACSQTFFCREAGHTFPIGERAVRTRFGSAFLASVRANPRVWVEHSDDARAESQPAAVNPLAAVAAGRIAAVDAVLNVLA